MNIKIYAKHGKGNKYHNEDLQEKNIWNCSAKNLHNNKKCEENKFT